MKLVEIQIIKSYTNSVYYLAKQRIKLKSNSEKRCLSKRQILNGVITGSVQTIYFVSDS